MAANRGSLWEKHVDYLWLDGYSPPSWAEEGLRRRVLEGTIHQRPCEHGHHVSTFYIVELLKSCTAMKDLHKGSKLHAYVREHRCLEKNVYIGNTLISMYAKCGALAEARQLLEALPMRDVVSWTALIDGHAQQGEGEEALKCFDDMLYEGHSPNAVTFLSVLKACGSLGTAAKGEEIHEKIVNMGMLQKNISLGNTLVDMYAKCGALAKAHLVLKKLPMRNVVSWNTLIAGYAQWGQGEEALKCFDDMLCEGYSPDVVTFICVLKACGSIRAVAKGEESHQNIISMGLLEKNSVLGNTLVDMYAKCGALVKSHQVLKELPLRDAVSWNALIAGYAQQGQADEALKCYDDMLCEGQSPDAVTFTCVLKACGSIRAAAKGEEIHGMIVCMGILEKNIVLGNILVDMYAKCGALAKAHQVLKELPMHNVVSWTALIAGYANQGQGEEAMKCFNDMLWEGCSPDGDTFACILKACGSIGAAAKGEEIHAKIVSLSMLEKNIVLQSALVDMYAKCGALAKAYQVLKEFPMRDIVSWNALIVGYVQQGQGEEALKCYDDMLREGCSPDAVAFACVLKSCGCIRAAALGEEIHEKVVSMGMLEKDIVLGSTLVDMYAKCRALAKAHQVLKELPTHGVVSWNALIAGYAQQGQGEEALKCFDDMLCEGHSPNVITFVCVLKACGSIGAFAKGEEIHDKIVSVCMPEKNVILSNSLIGMYVKCGTLAKAQQVLEDLHVCDAVSWTGLISGYAQQGQYAEALNCFERMQSNGVKPDLISLIIVLNACSSCGLLDHAETCFSGMSTKYGINPDLEHYCCMIDVFARAGKFNKALSVIVEMPYDKCLSSWVTLLFACRKWTEVKIGTVAFKHALSLDKCNAAVHVLMADICRAVGMQEESHTLQILVS